jgi:pectate lyase
MKNVIRLYHHLKVMVMLLFIVSISTAQAQLSENFDSGNTIPTSSGSAPTTPTDYTCTSGVWTLFKSYRHSTSNHSAPYAIRLLKNATASYAITPTLSSVGTITFWGYGASSKPIYLYKTTNSGSSWTFLDSAMTGAGSFVQATVVVNDPSSNIRIKFENGTVAINDLNFDDVVITSYSTSASISLSTTSLPSFGFVVSGSNSSSSSYTFSAHNLTANVKVKAPAGFKVSSDDLSFFDSLEVARTGDSISNATIYSHFAPSSAAGTVSGDISHSSTGAATQNVSVTGIALAGEPTTQSSITFGTLTGNSIVVNFSGGNGSNRILVARSGSAVSWSPSDGSVMTGVNSDFSLATDKGSGNKLVYDGTGGTVTVTGLTQSTTYHFAVYEYNVGTNNSQNYNTTSPGTGSQSTIALATIIVNPTSLEFGNVLVDSTSAEQSYTLSAHTLSPASGDITITAPSGYEVSTTSGSGFASSKLVAYSSGTLGATTIYIRFKPTTVANYTGNITNSGGGASTQNVELSGNGVTPSGPNILQAEDGIVLNAKILTQYPGYTGSGYVDIIDRQGSWLEASFRRAAASTDTLTIYYANGSGGSRSLALYLNDASLGSLSFPKTTNWSTWTSVKTVISFQAGINRIRLQATGSSATPNIDYFFIGGSEAILVYKLNLYKSGNGTVSANPSQTYYDAGTQVLLTAAPSGNNIFRKWIGGEESTSSSLSITMNAHKTIVGVMLDTTNFAGFNLETSPIGFASMNALGKNGTTGGAGGSVVFINNSKDLYDLMYVRLDASHSLNLEPITVYIVGTLSADPAFGEMLDVKDTYDASIIGVGQDAIITGFGLNLYRAVNIIVRNIKFASWGDDAISVDASDDETLGHHIWIDHCTFTYEPPPGYPAGVTPDGSIDITHTVSYATVSWNHFIKTDKNCLVGHSDSNTQDVAMKTTFHHNYFDSSAQRNPRVRFGKVHAFNNYYRKNTIYSVSSNTGADVVVEGNYFLDCPIPTESGRDGGAEGDIVQYNNIFVNCGTPEVVGTAFDPSTYYSFTVDPPSSIPDMVTKYAGSGKYDFSPNPPITSKVLNLTALIEGFYDGSTMVPDTVTVELHNSSSPYISIESKKIVLNAAGQGVGTFSIPVDGVNYYLAIKHRNSLQTWSNTTPSFSGGTMIYNFTSAQTQAYGSNMKNVGGEWCIYNGDVNADEFIDGSDVSDCFNDANIGASGYVVTDLTGDDFVDGTDVSIAFNNSNIGAGAYYPSKKRTNTSK